MISPDTAQPDEEAPEQGVAAAHAALLSWYAEHGRDLPWRHTRDAYAILVAEMMLQQTGVERVLPKYDAWLKRFPTLQALADAPTAEAIRLWSGLGYNSRAVRLQSIARDVVARYDGRLPASVDALMSLKGIGHYTAGAIACFAYEQDVAFVDTNVRRVLSRAFVGPGGAAGPLREKAMRELAERVLPRGRSWAWHQALMDLGATICTDARPACLICPLHATCRSAFRVSHVAREAGTAYTVRAKESPWRGSTRYYRGRIVALLAGLTPDQRIALDDLVGRIIAEGGKADGDPALVADLVTRLAAEGLVALHRRPDGQVDVSLPL